MTKKSLYRFFIITTIFFTLLINASRAQGMSVEEIDRAMKAGDINTLSGFFGNSVDITINKVQSTYSRTQAEIVLRNFFARNEVRDFDLEHTGKPSSANALFALGSLITKKGTFKVYMYLKKKDNNDTILQELRIEK